MIRVAAYQAQAQETFELRQKQIKELLSQADQKQIDFVCFPEGFLTGYYAEKELAWENSLDVTGDIFQAWLSQVKPFQATFMMGFNEKEGDKIYDSVAVIKEGKLLGIQRKHFLYHNYFTPGKSYSTFWSREVCFGVIVCLDANYFEPSRLLALQGATILFCPICNKVPLDHPYAKRPPYYSLFTARSFENRCWLVTADWIWPSDGQLTCPGHTTIYDPDGREIARSLEGKEQLLVIDIPKHELYRDKGKRIQGSSILFEQLLKLRNTDA